MFTLCCRSCKRAHLLLPSGIVAFCESGFVALVVECREPAAHVCTCAGQKNRRRGSRGYTSLGTVLCMGHAGIGKTGTLWTVQTTRSPSLSQRPRTSSCRRCARNSQRSTEARPAPTVAMHAKSTTCSQRWDSPGGRLRLRAGAGTLAARLGGLGGQLCCSQAPDVCVCVCVCVRGVAQIHIGSIFLVGCPACMHNFKHFFCTLACSPEQATFANVTAVQKAFDNNATAVSSVDYFMAADYGKAFYDSCKARFARFAPRPAPRPSRLCLAPAAARSGGAARHMLVLMSTWPWQLRRTWCIRSQIRRP
jgi:Niemann-Pick C1 N terminus